MRWNRRKTPSTKAIHLSTTQDLAGTGSPTLTWPVLHTAWGHSHDRWEGGSVRAREVSNQGASAVTNKTVVWLSERLFVKTGPTHCTVARSCHPTGLRSLTTRTGCKPTCSKTPQDNAHAKTLSHLLSQNTYLHKLHKSIFIYLQTITVYCIHCQKHITFCFSLKKRKEKKKVPKRN